MDLGRPDDVAMIRSRLGKVAEGWMKQHLHETMPLGVTSAVDENAEDENKDDDAVDMEKKLDHELL